MLKLILRIVASYPLLSSIAMIIVLPQHVSMDQNKWFFLIFVLVLSAIVFYFIVVDGIITDYKERERKAARELEQFKSRLANYELSQLARQIENTGDL